MLVRPPERTSSQLWGEFWLPVFAYVAAIYALSSVAGLTPPGAGIANVDKLYHAGEYFGLGILLARAMRAGLRVSRPLFAAMIAIGLVVVIGTTDEFLQSFIPGRDSSVFDLLADTVGGAIAQVVYVNAARLHVHAPKGGS